MHNRDQAAAAPAHTHDIWFLLSAVYRQANKHKEYTSNKHNGASWNGKAQLITTTTATTQPSVKCQLKANATIKFAYTYNTHFYFWCVCVRACLPLSLCVYLYLRASERFSSFALFHSSIWMIIVSDCGRIAFSEKSATHKNSKKWATVKRQPHQKRQQQQQWQQRQLCARHQRGHTKLNGK